MFFLSPNVKPAFIDNQFSIEDGTVHGNHQFMQMELNPPCQQECTLHIILFARMPVMVAKVSDGQHVPLPTDAKEEE